MKILGWMHRKFQTNEPLRDFSTANPCTQLSKQPSWDDLQNYPKPLEKPLREFHLRSSFIGLESKHFEEDDFEDDSSAENSELFHGFLTIGTFGSDRIVGNPTATPTFFISVENIAEKETAVTEDDLKLINDELEMVLGNEEDESPSRKSHMSTRRNSHASFEGANMNVNGTMTCPLEDYLFGSAIDLTETTIVRKERATLGELFQKTKTEDENLDDKTDRGEKRKEKGNENKFAIRVMKNFLKKKKGQASDTEKNVELGLKNKKMDKILRIFHRKVYPESSPATLKSDEPPKNEIKTRTKCVKRCRKEEQLLSEEDTFTSPQKSQKCFNLSQASFYGRDSNGNKECWIKTDSDYLVLEL